MRLQFEIVKIKAIVVLSKAPGLVVILIAAVQFAVAGVDLWLTRGGKPDLWRWLGVLNLAPTELKEMIRDPARVIYYLKNHGG
jgi:hypothetical protein